MMKLLCLGLGYCAARYVDDFGHRFGAVTGTARRERAHPGVTMIAYDGGPAFEVLANAIQTSSHLLVSAAPNVAGDPFLTRLRPLLEAAPQLQQVIYLSSIGVYGDHGGAWIDEATPAEAARARGLQRLDAERAWQSLGASRGIPVAVLRLAGIYGPGQNIFVRLREGRAHRIEKSGHVFNRIHVADIARTIDAAIARNADGVFNVCDDEPTATEPLILMAARMMGVEPPPPMSWDEARRTLSPMALSFYDSCNRVRNDRLRHILGVTLAYPTYREGLAALFAEDGAPRAGG